MTMMPLTNVILLGFSAPLWMPAIAWVVSRQKSSVVLLAVALMSVRWLGATEPMPRVLFYYLLLSTVMAIPLAVVQWQPLVPRAWIHLIGVGIAQLRSQVFIVLAYRYASSVKHLGMALVIGGGLVAISGKTDVSPAVVES